MIKFILEYIRSYKLFYALYNVFHASQLKHNIPLYKKYGISKKYYDSISSSDFKDLPEKLNWLDQNSSRDVLPNNEIFQSLSPQIQQEILPWSEKGFAVLDSFFSNDQVEAVNQSIEKLLQDKKISFKYRNKLMFAYKQSQVIESIGNDAELIKIMELLMSKEIQLFQSINFIQGSQQKAHSDSIHMTTYPLGNLIACWIALEDIHPDSGPLFYYPGSHKLPYILNSDLNNVGTKWRLGKKKNDAYEAYMEQMLANQNLEKEYFTPKKGSVLIWHANLIHGGAPRNQPNKTRKSMVFHYYTKDAICYHEISQRPALLSM